MIFEKMRAWSNLSPVVDRDQIPNMDYFSIVLDTTSVDQSEKVSLD